MRNELTPLLQRAAFFSVLAIFCSLVLGAVVSNVALGPLKAISRNLDSASAGDPLPEDEESAPMRSASSLKIAHLGRQIRDTNQIFSALKDNVEQVMSKLQDGLMLFTATPASSSSAPPPKNFSVVPAAKFSVAPPKKFFPMAPSSAPSFSPPSKSSGRSHSTNSTPPMAAAFRSRSISSTSRELPSARSSPCVTPSPSAASKMKSKSPAASPPAAASPAALPTRSRIPSTPSSFTSVAAKQNAAGRSRIRRHVDIIGNEIRRLDRVVQILIDFTRPRDLRLEDADLRKIFEDVATLAARPRPLGTASNCLRSSPDPLLVRADPDLMKQAILNLVINGIQAMEKGGTLNARAYREDEMIVGEVRDQGSGIPPEAQEKIFELYFTTKGDKGGSGIGLAQTYQIMQWHYGSVDFESIVGQGTTFLPASAFPP